jgi:ATP-dependent RNA helicase DDX21
LSPPKDSDTYVHRAGRTARAGASGICITLVEPRNQYRIALIEKETKIKFVKHGIP